MQQQLFTVHPRIVKDQLNEKVKVFIENKTFVGRSVSVGV